MKFRVEITMMDPEYEVEELTPARAETLAVLLDAAPAGIRIDAIAERRGITPQNQHALIKRMEENGSVKVNRSGMAHRASLTEMGYDRALAVGGGVAHDVEIDEAEAFAQYVKRLHGITVGFKVKNADRIDEEWRKMVADRSTVRWARIQREDGGELWTAVVQGWEVHMHREVVTAHMKRPIEKWTPDAAVRALVERVRDLRDRFERWTGHDIMGETFRIGRMECAFEEHHWAELVDAIPGIEMEDIKVRHPETEEKEVWMDRSKGPELETGGVRADVIAETIEDEQRQLAHHPGARRWTHGWEKAMAELGIRPDAAAQALARIADGAMEEEGEDNMAQSKSDEGEEESGEGEEARKDESGWAYVDGGTWRTW